MYPRQQGLKQKGIKPDTKCVTVFMMYPRQQGLKLHTLSSLLTSCQSFYDVSKTTRIET